MVIKLFKKNIFSIKNHVVSYLQKSYPNYNIQKENLILLNLGRFANATVFEYKSNNLNLTIKDFSGSPWLIRNTLGKLFINSEYKALLKLKDNPSIAKNIKRISKYTISFDYIEGKALKYFDNMSIEKNFFLELENNINLIHKKNIVHLDLRNLGNIIVGKNGYPYIIDFQSAISTKFLNNKLKNILNLSDLTGVYKGWNFKCIEPLDQSRLNTLEKFNKLRKIWIFKGYPLTRLMKKIKKFIDSPKFTN